MFATTTHIHQLSTCALSFILAVFPALARPALSLQDNSPAQKKYLIKPNKIQRGQTRIVSIIAADGSELPAGLEVDDVDLKGAGADLKTWDVQPDKTSKAATVKIAEDADLGSVIIRLKQGGKEVQNIEFKIEEYQPVKLPPQPTPGGISEVDVMWSILPEDVVKDNFGRHASKNFYGIEVVIGNNSGYDLQLTSIGFRSNLGTGAMEKVKVRVKEGDKEFEKDELVPKLFNVPTSDHRLVRGTVEKERLYGRRALAMNLMGGVGTLFAGFVPFYRAANPRANFSTFSSLFNGQLREGFNIAAPELTVGQLGRLENQSMTGEMIVPNNNQMRTVVFLPKDVLKLNSDDKKTDKNKAKISMPEVMHMLGDIVLVGRKVEFFNREVVVAPNRATETTRTGERGFLPPTSTTPTPTPTPLIEDLSDSVGTTLGNERLVILGSNFVNLSSVEIGKKTIPRAELTIKEQSIILTTPPHDKEEQVDIVVVTTAGRSQPKKFFYNAPTPTPTPTPTPPPIITSTPASFSTP